MTPIKLDIPKRPSRGRPLMPASTVAHDLAEKLAKLHREHGGIGPLLFGVMYHQEIANCPDKPETLAELAGVGKYASDISKGKRLAAHVLVRNYRR